MAGGMFALVSMGKKTTKMGGFPLVSSPTAEKARSFQPESAGTQSSGVTAKFAPQPSIL